MGVQNIADVYVNAEVKRRLQNIADVQFSFDIIVHDMLQVFYSNATKK